MVRDASQGGLIGDTGYEVSLTFRQRTLAPFNRVEIGFIIAIENVSTNEVTRIVNKKFNSYSTGPELTDMQKQLERELTLEENKHRVVEELGKLVENANTVEQTNSNQYIKTDLTGDVTVSYGNNNGVFTIGSDELEFQTEWSNAGTDGAYCYGRKVRGIALAPEGTSINEIRSLQYLDFENNDVYKTMVGSLIVLQGQFGGHAILEITKITYDGPGALEGSVSFNYWTVVGNLKNFSPGGLAT